MLGLEFVFRGQNKWEATTLCMPSGEDHLGKTCPICLADFELNEDVTLTFKVFKKQGACLFGTFEVCFYFC